MWDTVAETHQHGRVEHLSHDMPCQSCGHALHTFLACGEGCDCGVRVLPGAAA